MRVGSVWYDGFNFQVPSGNTCLTLDTPAGVTVKVGENRIPVSSAFNIETLDPCGQGGGQPEISIGDAQVTEGDGTATATLNVSLSQPSTSTVMVDYQTENGSASAGSDYFASSGTVTFTPGVTSQSVMVTIIDPDMQPENTESFSVKLDNAVNATIADDTGVVTILDDDGAAGGACGDPGYDRASERELFIWQDCVSDGGDGTWYVRATAGGGSALNYIGNLTTDESFSNVAPFSLESNDMLANTNAQVIEFNMRVGSVWYDGFDFQVDDFQLPAGSNTCLTLDAPAGITVKAGQNRTPVSSAFNIETLGPCAP
jgi:hypothetical protein